ncbi:hypothetical protein [Priestia endophytica]|uniref:hypothetical protein n=1 Tax=Priestia endophytica TaxID=135735 RepID=UPI000DCA4A92|nr:hypothetical protein [Priestia endophytica]RAS80269.1 hypothetical protein A4U60_16500 [Priestia endophytica]
MEISKLSVSEHFQRKAEKTKELMITNGSRPQGKAKRVMVVRAFEVLHGEFELEDYQKKEVLKTFLEVKDKMPLNKTEEEEID